MRALLLFLVGSLGIAAFWRRLWHRGGDEDSTPDPADELRAKLAETKADTVEEAEPPDVEPPSVADDPAARRDAIHERARAAMDELA